MQALSATEAANSGQITLSGSHWIADAPTKVADQLTLFNPPDSEFPVEVTYSDSGKASLIRLLAGEVDYAMVASTPVAQSLLEQYSQGVAEEDELVVLASVALSNRSHYLVVDASRGLGSPRDLEGRRVGVMHDTSAEFGWSLFANFHGIPADNVTLVDGSTDELAELMKHGAVDAVMAWDPWGRALLDDMGERATLFRTRQLYTVNWLLVTTRGQLIQSPEIAVRIVDGYRKAIDLIDTNPAAARALHARVTGDPEKLLEELETGVMWSLRLNWSVVANLEAQLVWFRRRRPELDGPVPSPERYLDAGPLLEVAPEWVMLPDYLYGLHGGGAP